MRALDLIEELQRIIEEGNHGENPCVNVVGYDGDYTEIYFIDSNGNDSVILLPLE